MRLTTRNPLILLSFHIVDLRIMSAFRQFPVGIPSINGNSLIALGFFLSGFRHGRSLRIVQSHFTCRNAQRANAPAWCRRPSMLQRTIQSASHCAAARHPPESAAPGGGGGGNFHCLKNSLNPLSRAERGIESCPRYPTISRTQNPRAPAPA